MHISNCHPPPLASAAVSRFAGDVEVAVGPAEAFVSLQDPAVWAAVLGAAEVSHIRHDDDGLLQSCEWLARIAGSELTGTFVVDEARSSEYMSVLLRAAEWQGSIAVTLEPVEPGTKLHARLELNADGFTALMLAPLVTKIVGDAFPSRLQEFAELLAG